MMEWLPSSFSLMAVYLTLKRSHRTPLGYDSHKAGFPAKLWEVYHPVPFFLIALSAPSLYFWLVGWEAGKVGHHVDEAKYILRSPPSPVLRLYGGGTDTAWHR